jgi:hypothetical protein
LFETFNVLNLTQSLGFAILFGIVWPMGAGLVVRLRERPPQGQGA